MIGLGEGLEAGGSEAVGSSLGVIEVGDFLDGGVSDGRDDHLRDAVAVLDGVGELAEIDECDEHFASVVCVDGAWCVWE